MKQLALNNLWIYIQSLQLSQRNRKWLSDKLIEPVVDEKSQKEREWDEALYEMEQGMGEVYTNSNDYFSQYL